MITMMDWNLFDCDDGITIAIPVNCRGVMGAGLAKEAKERYPDMFDFYLQKCNSENPCDRIKTGETYLYQGEGGASILLFPTKDHWMYDSKIEYIEQGLDHFVENFAKWGITRVAFPALGCGLGRLSRRQVRELLISKLRHLDLDVLLLGLNDNN